LRKTSRRFKRIFKRILSRETREATQSDCEGIRMTITNYIAELTKLRDEHGDLEVFQGGWSQQPGAVILAGSPCVENLAILHKRERVLRTWSRYNAKDTPETVGRKIVRIGR
jgi:hypothetical protein